MHPCGRYRHNTVVFILAKEYNLKNLRTIHRYVFTTDAVDRVYKKDFSTTRCCILLCMYILFFKQYCMMYCIYQIVHLLAVLSDPAPNIRRKEKIFFFENLNFRSHVYQGTALGSNSAGENYLPGKVNFRSRVKC